MAIEDILRICRNIQELERGGQKVVYTADHPDHGAVVLKRGVRTPIRERWNA